MSELMTCMGMTVIEKALLKALLPTIIVEEICALFWKERSPRLACLVFMVNCLTNPAINLIVALAPDSWLASPFRFHVFVSLLEIAVVFCEAWLFRRFPGGVRPFRRALIFSLVLNACSYFSGYLLGFFGYWG